MIRACHPEATIILPCEKIQVRSGDNVRALIAPRVASICEAIARGADEWHGYTAECRIRQVRRALYRYFYFHAGSISPTDLDDLLDELIFIKRK